MIDRSLRNLLAASTVVVLGVAGFLFLTERPLAVPVAVVEKNVAIRVYGLGSVEARILSKIGFEVGAALTDLTVDNGDTVVRGQVLARLHSAEQEARVARAKAAVAGASASLSKAETNVIRAEAVLAQRLASNARRQQLAGRSVVSTQAAEEAQLDADVATAELGVAQSEIDVVKAQYADAEAAELLERTLLDHHVLRAPFDAVIVNRHVEAGTVIRAGEVIFTIMDPATIWTIAYIDEERAGFLSIGLPAEVRLRSQPRQVFQGKVARIGIESDRANEERRVWLTCQQCPTQVYLGEQAEVLITTAVLPSALLVPENAIRGFDGFRGQAWTVQNGKLAQTILSFGHRTENARLELLDGLPEGAHVVTAPLKQASEGRRARIVEGDAP